MLIIGNALHGLYYLPYALQLANNWTKLAFYQNVIAVIILAPAIYFSTLLWGSIGAAGVWILLNIGYLTISVQVMHRQLLKKEKWRWYANDIGKPLVIILLIVYAGRSFMNEAWQNSWTILLLTLTLIVSSVVALWSCNSLRFLFSFAFRGHNKWLKH